MTTKTIKMLVPTLSAAVLGLLICILFLVLKNANQRLEARQAWNVIADYDRVRDQLTGLNIADIYAYLDIETRRKLIWDDRDINKIVLQERELMVRDILTELRKRTGEDFGSDPTNWVNRYYQSLKK